MPNVMMSSRKINDIYFFVVIVDMWWETLALASTKARGLSSSTMEAGMGYQPNS